MIEGKQTQQEGPNEEKESDRAERERPRRRIRRANVRKPQTGAEGYLELQ